MSGTALRLVTKNGVHVDGSNVDGAAFETAALASDAFAAVFGHMGDLLRRGEHLRARGVSDLCVAFDEYVTDLERQRMLR
jgi:hypothetical protein